MVACRMRKEQWRAVVGEAGRYEVSDRGRFRSFVSKGRRSGKPVLVCGTVHDGCRRVTMSGSPRSLAGLVLAAFTGPAPSGTVAAHLDGDPTNDQLKNLRWMTSREIHAHRREEGLIPAPDMAARFWARVAKGAPNACWEWQGAKLSGNRGYGRIRRPGPQGMSGEIGAHRLAWEVVHGAVPPGMSVLHQCDNPPCCNPAHLFLGTQLDNVHDMIQKGRNAPMPPPKRA